MDKHQKLLQKVLSGTADATSRFEICVCCWNTSDSSGGLAAVTESFGRPESRRSSTCNETGARRKCIKSGRFAMSSCGINSEENRDTQV